MRVASFLSLCLLPPTSCGIIAHQIERAKKLLTAPFRAELDQRFLDGELELDREHEHFNQA